MAKLSNSALGELLEAASFTCVMDGTCRHCLTLQELERRAPTLARLVLDQREAGEALMLALTEEHAKRGLPMKHGCCVLRCHYCDAMDNWAKLDEEEERDG